MSTSSLRRSLAAIAFGGLLAAGSVTVATPAHADPVENYAALNAGAVCSTLDEFPTVAGVTGVVQGVMEDSGFSPYDAGRVVATAVLASCPAHITELQRFIAVCSNAGTVRA